MSTFANDTAFGFGSAGAAAQSLLTQVAQLCVISKVSESDAIEMFRAAFHDAGRAEPVPLRADDEAFVAAQVLSEWHQNSDYLDADCNPKPLSLRDDEFAGLCRSASVRAEPNTLLDLLLQAGAVRIDNEFVAATRRQFILGDTHPVAVARALRLCAGFSSTLNYNLKRSVSEPSRFERSVVNVRLGPRHIPALLGYLSVHGQSFLEDLDSWMSSRETNCADSVVGVGVYIFVGDDDV